MTALLAILKPHVRNLGGFSVRRLLPAHARKMVGPFIFFDHMGPADFAPGTGVDVRPHPHIGLATVTYLFEGAMLHRDSLGTVQRINPGDVNWMTAGCGIVHSERSTPEDRAGGHRVEGIQTWVALPQPREDLDPVFSHHVKETLPLIHLPGAQIRVIAGSACGARSPVHVYSHTLYAAAELKAGASFMLHPEHEERAVYLVDGDAHVAGEMLAPQHMAVLPAAATVRIGSDGGARLMLLGGEKMDGDRHIWWNFVASTQAAIEAAKQRWRDGEFDAVPGEGEVMPSPD